MLWLMLLCYYSTVASAIAGGCSITDVSASIVTSTTVLLRWSESEDCSVKNYSITASHVKYKACPAHVTFKEPSIVTSNSAEATKALVSGLEPYSIYTFNISSRIDNGFLVPLKLISKQKQTQLGLKCSLKVAWQWLIHKPYPSAGNWEGWTQHARNKGENLMVFTSSFMVWILGIQV